MILKIEVRDCLGRVLGRSGSVDSDFAPLLRELADVVVEPGTVMIRCDDPSFPGVFVQVQIKATNTD